MKISLGNGFEIDASDGVNWTLRQDRGNKTPALIGHYANLQAALRGALNREAQIAQAIVLLDDLDDRLGDIADQILNEVTITIETDPRLGTVKRFYPKRDKAVLSVANA